jgi:UDP-N-acetylglucosamine:LPS N-acetylglucosamine transferase
LGAHAGPPRPAATGWHVLAGDSWQTDPWPILAGADVVVTHAGQNALAEVAAARRPAVVVPAQRPFGEQTASADALARAGIAVVERTWPAPERWPQVLDRARALGGNGWRRWSTGSAAEAAARVIEDVARTGGAW